MMLAALPLFGGIALAPSHAFAYVPPTRTRGSKVLNVKDYGALGNGTHDDTVSIQNAIAALPSDGGTVFIPAGTYKIDALKSLKLRHYMHLQMDPNAKLVAIPNSADVYRVILLEELHDVEISGGQIVGERDQHKGTTGEGGHGITVHGSSRITIRDILVSKGWGDGISVGPAPQYKAHYVYSKDVSISNVICDQNRRNGLSITNVIGMKVFDSQFINTNGTKPQCGIDVEPSSDIDDLGYNDQVWIENCIMRGNAVYGVNVWKRVRNLVITKCLFDQNHSCGMVTTGMESGSFTENTFSNNMKTGLYIQTGSTDVTISGNTFFKNYLLQRSVPRAPFCMSGVASKIQKDLIVGKGTVNIHVQTNCYK
jgi:parallel beta-helix repeat protein